MSSRKKLSLTGTTAAFLLLLVLSVANQFSSTMGAADTWDYKDKGPSQWARLFPQFCDGTKQSPIDLNTKTARQDSIIKKFVFHQSNIVDNVKLSLKNDGHKVELNWSPQLSITMGQTDTDQMYKAAQLHWHWGGGNERGSEHTIDGKSYPAEGHLVFYNSKDYPDLGTAASRPNGLAVLGVFYELSDTDNPLFQVLDRALANDSLVSAGGVTELTAGNDFKMFSTFLPNNQDEFFRYDGSLTTPNCFESVLWTVYRHTVPISARQLGLLRRLHFTDNSSMVDNYRPPLALNPGARPGTPRTLYRTFSSGAANSFRPLPTTLATVVLMTLTALTGRVAA